MKGLVEMVWIAIAAIVIFSFASTQSVFIQPMSVTAERITVTYSSGDVFTRTFSLENTDVKTLPESGAVSRETLWYAYIIRDSGNNQIVQSEPVEVTSPILSGGIVNAIVSYGVTPASPNGKYIAGAVLFKIPQVYDADTGMWLQGVERVLDKQAVEFTVAGTSVNPPMRNFLQDLLDGIAGFFNRLFGR